MPPGDPGRGRELLLDVDVVVELVHELVRKGVTHLLVLEELRRTVAPRLVVEQLPLRPDRQRPDEGDDRREN